MSDDLISKQEVLNKLNELDQQELYLPCHFKEYVIDKVSNISQKTGQWIPHKASFPIQSVYSCSKCNSSVPSNIFVVGCDFEFCPYCGAKMKDGRNMSEEETIIDHLERILFFNQRAGRELWFDKPKEVQDRDIENNERDLQETINYIRTNQRKQGQTTVKHGKWEHDRCTECGKSLDDLFSGEFYYDNEEVNFCPNCGAKMEDY